MIGERAWDEHNPGPHEDLLDPEGVRFMRLVAKGSRDGEPIMFESSLREWAALHNLAARTRTLERTQLRRMTVRRGWGLEDREALKLGLRLRKLFDENPSAPAVSTGTCSCRLGALGRERKLDLRRIVVSRGRLEAFADFCCESAGFKAC